jgi:hypothetical protein
VWKDNSSQPEIAPFKEVNQENNVKKTLASLYKQGFQKDEALDNNVM